MDIKVKQVSSLKKIRTTADLAGKELEKAIVLGGESYSYQVAVVGNEYLSDEGFNLSALVESEIKDYVKLYFVKNVIMDCVGGPHCKDTDRIATEPGMMPDLLVPIESQNNVFKINRDIQSVWVEINIPENFSPGKYKVAVVIKGCKMWEKEETVQIKSLMEIEVLGLNKPVQSTAFTQWFHVDCIANVHNVPIYSDEHWSLIDKYMALANELGINMLLTPVITPPLDTKEGLRRPCTQLVKIEKNGNLYSFDFTLLRKWIALCKKNNIRYYEISHLFSQWGLKYTPNIKVLENGEEKFLFGWHKASTDEEYKNFLTQLLPALMDIFESENIKEHCLFHLSDEPQQEHLENYKYAHSIVKPLIGDCKIIDALSIYDFYKMGLVDVPVIGTDHIEPFLDKDITYRWCYYCLGGNKISNRFLDMPSYRNRIIGFQMYKYNMEGFLQWAFNFYYSQWSMYPINPYLTTSGDRSYPSGDPFSVYPSKGGAHPSLRAKIFKEALQDIDLLKLLESYIGKEKVLEILEDGLDKKITFTVFPRNEEYIPAVMNKVKNLLKQYAK